MTKRRAPQASSTELAEAALTREGETKAAHLKRTLEAWMAKATLTKNRAYPANRPCQMPETIWVMIRVTKVGFFPLTVKRSYTSAEERGFKAGCSN